MLGIVAQFIVGISGVLICILAGWGIVAPDRIVQFGLGFVRSRNGILLAALIRIILGVSLVVAAAGSRFPLTFETLGWLTILAAVALLFIGSARVQAIVAWAGRRTRATIRIWLLCGFALGCFLLIGVA